MAVLRQFNLKPIVVSYGVRESVVEDIRSVIGREFWKWYFEHEDDKIVTVKKFIFGFTVKVKHIRGVFELLFGEYQP